MAAQAGSWSQFDQSKDLVLELHAGEGGEDSRQFVNELYDAYKKYAHSLQFLIEVLDSSSGHIAARISGRNVWKAFKYESGQHVVQRVPHTERNGRRQTSIISVLVLPIPPTQTHDLLPLGEVEFIAQKGQLRAGGQKANKTSSAIRAKHRPTGISVFIQTERQQGQNKQEALSLLTVRVNSKRNKARQDAYSSIRNEQFDGGGRGNKIRTYNFMRSEIVDHRLNKSTKDLRSFMRGQFNVLLPSIYSKKTDSSGDGQNS